MLVDELVILGILVRILEMIILEIGDFIIKNIGKYFIFRNMERY